MLSAQHCLEFARDKPCDSLRHVGEVMREVQLLLDEHGDVVVDRVQRLGDGCVSIVEAVRHEQQEPTDGGYVQGRVADEWFGRSGLLDSSTVEHEV